MFSVGLFSVYGTAGTDVIVALAVMMVVIWLLVMVVYFICNWAGLWEVWLNVVFSL